MGKEKSGAGDFGICSFGCFGDAVCGFVYGRRASGEICEGEKENPWRSQGLNGKDDPQINLGAKHFEISRLCFVPLGMRGDGGRTADGNSKRR